jgi:Tol biopolymer transport system component
VSRNGRYVVYSSNATNLVRGDTNGVGDAFIHDLATGRTRRISVGPGGRQGNGGSFGPAVSANGRYVVFCSNASNLVRGDTNRATDIFLWDRSTRDVRRVSVGQHGVQANADAQYRAAISGDGRHIVFRSWATNLVPGDTNGEPDLFLRDLESHRTRRVSLSDEEEQANGDSGEPIMSADGRYLAFQSTASNLVPGDTDPAHDIYLRDLQTGSTELLSVRGGDTTSANGQSYNPAISAAGRYVAFASTGSNLVPMDDNGAFDVFVFDRSAGDVTRVSVSGGEREANGPSREVAISADGRFVGFRTEATNLVRTETGAQPVIVVRDRSLGTTTLVSRALAGAPDGPSVHPMMANDGRIAYTSDASNLVRRDTNRQPDIFVQDPGTTPTLAGTAVAAGTVRVSVSSRERQANHASKQPATNGRYVVFASDASNLVPGDTNGHTDVFRRDLRTGTTRRLSVGPQGRQANDNSTQPVISRDGSVVLFVSKATNLVRGDTNGKTDVFAWENGRARRISVTESGGQANGDNLQPAISADGRFAAFESSASNLLPGDTNRRMDIYRRSIDGGATTLVRISVGQDEQQGQGASFGPVLNATGGIVAFMSAAPNLVPGDTNGVRDVFVRTPGGDTQRISVSNAGGQGNANSFDPAISADGTVVSFSSDARTLVPGDDNASTDVFVHDRTSGTTQVVSVRGNRTLVPGDSKNAAISADGRRVVFASAARRLVDGDTNRAVDIFVRLRAAAVTRRVSLGASGQANGPSDEPVINPAGTQVAFSSAASNLVRGDTNGDRDIFRRQL